MFSDLLSLEDFKFSDPKDDILTMVFIHPQSRPEMYEPAKGFQKGTAFPDLDKPLRIGGPLK